MTTKEKIQVFSTHAIPDTLLNRLSEVSPELRFSVRPVNLADEIPAEIWAEVEVLITDQVLPDPSLAPKLRWVQFLRASLEHVQDHEIRRIKDIHLTTLSGANAPQAAESALMSLLALGHRIPQKLAVQKKGNLDTNHWKELAPFELQKRTVGIVGYGSVGRELTRLLQMLEVNVLAAKYDAMKTVDEGFVLKGKGDPEGNLFQRLYPYQAVRSMIRDCDFVVLTVPLTDKSRQMIGKGELEAMKPEACLVNISHRQVMDEGALAEALNTGQLGGVVLTVHPGNPISVDSPLWDTKNIIFNPRVSWANKHDLQKAAALLIENFERYSNGTGLLNRFNPDKGY